ncbi:MAG: hypothetical protein DCC56_00030 [Anaerolineae bacterium]|nr:MAG: hypothetical protein DCC56_00030 [Anaerolineae bacterium]WKZ44415.1 MAG: hypothetical protein QY302_01330 [Anaerolineales bacterium]
MKTISLESPASVNAFSFKSALALLGQWFGALIAFIIAMIAADIASPLPQFIMEQTPESGFMSLGAAMLFSAAVNATIVVWAARRSSLKGFALAGGLFVLSFLAQVFQTQIETAYFLPAFPLLHGNFEVYRLILRGAITSAIFVVLVTLIVGGFSRKPRAESKFTVHASQFLKVGAWLAALYFVLYILFGYYVAWQSQELRVFYGGPAELNSFSNQILTTLMTKPEMPFFQFARGFVWIVCLIPLFKSFTGRRVELVALSALALALLPTAQLAFANPLMPAEVSLYHFWETSISTGIFGALCAWYVVTKSETE